MDFNAALEVLAKAKQYLTGDEFEIVKHRLGSYKVKRITSDKTDRAIIAIARNEAIILRNSLLDLASIIEAVINNDKRPNGGN